MHPADRPDLLALVRCPSCHQRVENAPPAPDNVDRLACSSCQRSWPVRFGIPDFRDRDAVDPYLSADEDLRTAERLYARSQAGGFADALESYYAANERVPIAQARRFIAGTLAAEERARAVLADWQGMAGGAAISGLVIDLGCGTGPLLPALAAAGASPVGIDVGLRWLVLAAARLQERGMPVVLACAGAVRLPLAASSVDAVVSESLIENVPPAGVVLEESCRVLRPGGRLWLTTANRHSIGPDPHLGVLAGGWLTQGALVKLAKRRGMVPPHRALLSARDLARELARCGLTGIRIAPPPVADAQAAGRSLMIRVAVRAYRAMAGSTPGRRVLSAIGPSLTAVASKPG